MSAYSELYLNDAQIHLANGFDYAINDCGITADEFAAVFSHSEECANFERGNPCYISGCSGEELVTRVITNVYRNKNLPQRTFRTYRSPEYWAGWVLGYFQWYTGLKLNDVFKKVALSNILCMYKVFHESDVSVFTDSLLKMLKNAPYPTKLKLIRQARGLSQSKLAISSGVSLRMIQLYEQRANNINKAEASSLFKLSSALGCYISDLLEDN